MTRTIPITIYSSYADCILCAISGRSRSSSRRRGRTRRRSGRPRRRSGDSTGRGGRRRRGKDSGCAGRYLACVLILAFRAGWDFKTASTGGYAQRRVSYLCQKAMSCSRVFCAVILMVEVSPPVPTRHGQYSACLL